MHAVRSETMWCKQRQPEKYISTPNIAIYFKHCDINCYRCVCAMTELQWGSKALQMKRMKRKKERQATKNRIKEFIDIANGWKTAQIFVVLHTYKIYSVWWCNGSLNIAHREFYSMHLENDEKVKELEKKQHIKLHRQRRLGVGWRHRAQSTYTKNYGATFTQREITTILRDIYKYNYKFFFSSVHFHSICIFDSHCTVIINPKTVVVFLLVLCFFYLSEMFSISAK